MTISRGNRTADQQSVDAPCRPNPRVGTTATRRAAADAAETLEAIRLPLEAQ